MSYNKGWQKNLKKCRKMSKIFFNSDVWFYEWFPIEGGGALTPHPFLLIGVIIYNIWYVLETSTSKIWKNGKFAKKKQIFIAKSSNQAKISANCTNYIFLKSPWQRKFKCAKSFAKFF